MNSAVRGCFHCGLPVPATLDLQAVVLGEPRAFCCAGCQAVAETIVDSGLEDYYRDREKRADAPAALPASLQSLRAWDHPAAQKDFVTLEGEQADAELSLENLNCAACAWLIEKKLQQETGVLQATVNLSTHRLHLEWDSGHTSLSRVLATLAGIGYRAHPYRSDTHSQQLQKESRDLLLRMAVAGFGMMQVMMYAGALYVGAWTGIEAEYRDYLNWVNLVITAPIFFYSGKPFYRSAWVALKNRHLNMDVPVSLALVAAFIASVYATLSRSGETYYDSITMFIFFLLASHFLETRARRRAGDTAANLMALAPQLATRVEADESQNVIAAGELKSGDRVIVKPGETVPADAVVLDGRSAVSEALLTGEPLPVLKQPGDAVIGGSLNSDGSLLLRVTREAGEGTLSSLNRLLNRALAEKPRLAQRADAIAQVFVAIVLAFSVVVLAAWWYADSFSHAFWITLAVLVATCPCALSLATPVALTSATGTLAEGGFLISRGHVLETLSQATHVLFDKTGTLTTGTLHLESSEALRGDVDSALRLVCALEQRSEHPVAQAFQALPLAKLPAVQDMEHQAGAGVSGTINGRHYRFGHARFALGEDASTADLEKLWLVDDDGALAAFRLTDTLRPEAADVIRQLQARGLQTWLLSGDRSGTPQAMGATLGMQQVFGGLTPAEKREKVQALQQTGAIVVMVGDGVNDAPVLGQAHLSVAMASGTDLAQLTADSLLLRDDLRMLVRARDLSRRTGRLIRQNLGWAMAYNLGVLPPAALGMLPPWAAALGMSLSSLVVVGNALRLRLPSRNP
ncbi:MAG: carbonate dehydratase [Moraxellaceae bacterium]|jgi:Cu2+-exporting ATPase|nr:carbonate dehydratase [Moraxellaceae bacterium]